MAKADQAPGIEIRPATSTLVVLGILVSPLLILGVVSWAFQTEQLAGAALTTAGLLVWGSVATIRITLRNGLIVRRVFWRTSWSIASADAVLEVGRGGDVPLIPALLVKRRSTGEKVGEILRPQFHGEELAAFAAAVQASDGGAHVR